MEAKSTRLGDELHLEGVVAARFLGWTSWGVAVYAELRIKFEERDGQVVFGTQCVFLC